MGGTPSRPRPSWRRAAAGIAALTVLGGLAACTATGGTPGPGTAGAPTAGASGAPASAIVGSWTSTISKADLADAGIADPNVQNENSGRFTTTFGADGDWTTVQAATDGSPINNPVFRGTYTVEGSSLVMTTTFPAEYVDKGLHYTWSVDADGLHLDLLDPPDPILPVVVESHPWSPAD